MTIDVKICGLSDGVSVAAAVEGGARYAGFVFYPSSPRAVTAETVADLLMQIPSRVTPVGLFVDPTDDDLNRVLKTAPLRMIQLHGNETPERVVTIKKLTGLPVIKAVGISTSEDIAAARTYEHAADILLFDAKPQSLPGGNAVAFDWSLLKKQSFAKPWMLAGGLDETNIAAAVAASDARMLDVSSGVEEARGRKNPSKIKAFLQKARKIETCC